MVHVPGMATSCSTYMVRVPGMATGSLREANSSTRITYNSLWQADGGGANGFDTSRLESHLVVGARTRHFRVWQTDG
jgi:hypothetical protein